MDSRKRRRVEDGGADRLGDLPDCLLQDILSRLGSRQAVQMSALSRRWRHLWRDVTCVDIDQREFSDRWQSFEDFADHISSLPPAPQLDAFRLHLVNSFGYATDRWIRRCLGRFPAAVHIHVNIKASARWPPPSLSLASCTRRLTRLRLFGVSLEDGSFGEHLGAHCPVLEDLHIDKCRMYQLGAVTSHTLKSLAIIDPQAYGGGTDLVLTAPRLASLRLDLKYDGRYAAGAPGAPEKEALASVAQASIRITDMGHQFERNQRARKKGKLAFLRAMCSFLARLPNVTNLDLSGFTTTALLDEETQEFPVLHNLRTLLLEECDVGVSFQALTSILRNVPNLEKLGLHRCTFLGPPAPKRRTRKAEARAQGDRRKTSSRRRSSTPPPLVFKNLKSIEIKGQQDDAVKVLSEISKGIPEDMPLARWRRVEELSDVDSTMVQLFRTETRTKLTKS